MDLDYEIDGVTYYIIKLSTLEQNTGTCLYFAVKRRYTDFEFAQKQFHAAHAGCAIPSIPKSEDDKYILEAVFNTVGTLPFFFFTIPLSIPPQKLLSQNFKIWEKKVLRRIDRKKRGFGLSKDG